MISLLSRLVRPRSRRRSDHLRFTVYTRDGRLHLTELGEVQSVGGLPIVDPGGAPISVDPAAGPTFDALYRERHVPLVQAVPGLERFTLTRPRGGDGTPYLVAELWFADLAAMKAGLGSPQMAAAGADADTYDVARWAMFTGEVEEL